MIFNTAKPNRRKIAKKRKKAINRLTSSPYSASYGQNINQSNYKW